MEDYYFEKLRELKEETERIIQENYDDREKNVGDYVIVWDNSSVTCYDTGDSECIADDDKYYVVISDNENSELSSVLYTYKQDLVVVDPDTVKYYRVSSDHVKLKD